MDIAKEEDQQDIVRLLLEASRKRKSEPADGAVRPSSPSASGEYQQQPATKKRKLSTDEKEKDDEGDVSDMAMNE